jgi:predicted RNA-binding Zn-ribbon protein involved in translation (DUF1610 family)
MDIQHNAVPVAGKDYPRNWNEFLDSFGSEEACQAYLEGLRWPQGFVCPNCGVMAPASRASRGRLLCKDCGHQSTVTAGTIFDKTRTPLRVWLAGAWYLTNQKLGVSALGLQRVLGLGSYQTAWTMLHRFRKAMVRRDRERLHGQVEVDETYLPMYPCPECTEWLRWSSAGSWGHTTDRYSRGTLTPISMSSFSASIAAVRARAECCSTGCCSKP